MAEQQNDKLVLEVEWIGGHKAKVTARFKEDPVHIDTIDPSKDSQRKRFVKTLEQKSPAAKDQNIDGELVRIADSYKTIGEPTAEIGSAESQDSAALLAQMLPDVLDEAHALLNNPELIQQIVDDVALLGVAGEKELTATIYLVGVSRFLPRPLAAIIQGPSSSGKSYLIDRTASLFPPEAVIQATQMTPQALFHMKPGTLAHRFVAAGERSRIKDDERAEATRALREMLPSGKLTKLMPVKTEGGRIETVEIKQDGPIAYIESTTLAKVFDEDANRCLMLHTDERADQTRRIIRQLATAHAQNTGTETDRIVHRHHALQRMLRPLPIVVPYAEQLGELFCNERVEARRAFPQLISMIHAIALLHQRQRAQDTEGGLIATAEDYHLARRLLLKPMERLLGGRLSDPARRFSERLETWWPTGNFTTSEATNKETGSKSSVYGWLHELHEAGIVDMVERSRGRVPATWRRLGKAPNDAACAILPALETLFPGSTWKHGHKLETVMKA